MKFINIIKSSLNLFNRKDIDCAFLKTIKIIEKNEKKNLYYIIKGNGRTTFKADVSITDVENWLCSTYSHLRHGDAGIYECDGRLLKVINYCNSNDVHNHAICSISDNIVLHIHTGKNESLNNYNTHKSIYEKQIIINMSDKKNWLIWWIKINKINKLDYFFNVVNLNEHN